MVSYSGRSHGQCVSDCDAPCAGWCVRTPTPTTAAACQGFSNSLGQGLRRAFAGQMAVGAGKGGLGLAEKKPTLQCIVQAALRRIPMCPGALVAASECQNRTMGRSTRVPMVCCLWRRPPPRPPAILLIGRIEGTRGILICAAFCLYGGPLHHSRNYVSRHQGET